METSSLSVPSHPHDIIKATLARLVRRNALAWLAVPLGWVTVALVFLVFPQADAWMDITSVFPVGNLLAHVVAVLAFIVLPQIMACGAPWAPEPPKHPTGQPWCRGDAVMSWPMAPGWLRPILSVAISSRPHPPTTFALLCFLGVPAQHADVCFILAALCSCFYHGVRAYIMRLWEHLVLAGGMAVAGVVLATMEHPSRTVSLLVVAAVTTIYLLAMCWTYRVQTTQQPTATDES